MNLSRYIRHYMKNPLVLGTFLLTASGVFIIGDFGNEFRNSGLYTGSSKRTAQGKKRKDKLINSDSFRTNRMR